MMNGRNAAVVIPRNAVPPRSRRFGAADGIRYPGKCLCRTTTCYVRVKSARNEILSGDRLRGMSPGSSGCGSPAAPSRWSMRAPGHRARMDHPSHAAQAVSRRRDAGIAAGRPRGSCRIRAALLTPRRRGCSRPRLPDGLGRQMVNPPGERRPSKCGSLPGSGATIYPASAGDGSPAPSRSSSSYAPGKVRPVPGPGRPRFPTGRPGTDGRVRVRRERAAQIGTDGEVAVQAGAVQQLCDRMLGAARRITMPRTLARRSAPISTASPAESQDDTRDRSRTSSLRPG